MRPAFSCPPRRKTDALARGRGDGALGAAREETPERGRVKDTRPPGTTKEATVTKKKGKRNQVTRRRALGVPIEIAVEAGTIRVTGNVEGAAAQAAAWYAETVERRLAAYGARHAHLRYHELAEAAACAETAADHLGRLKKLGGSGLDLAAARNARKWARAELARIRREVRRAEKTERRTRSERLLAKALRDRALRFCKPADAGRTTLEATGVERTGT